jgi:hypothetical protein
MAAVPRPRFGGPAAGARRGPAGPAPIRALPAGVVIASGGFEPALTVLAPWWQPDPELYAVVVRFDRAVFGVGDRWLPAPEFGELVAGQPDWGGRPVLLIVEGKVANSAVQQLADVLQVGVVTGPAAQGRWWAAMPRRADRGQAQVRALGARYPFSPAELAGLRVARPLPLPVGPGAAAALLADRLQPGAVLDQPGFPAGEPSRERFNRWRGSAWRPGQFGVAVRRGFGYPAAPYRNGELLWTTWQLANALWEIREQWADASELVLLTDGTPGGNLGELRLLANYLQVAVRAGNRPLWTGQDRVEVASATVRPDADGRLRPALAVPPDGRWITVRPRGGLRPPARPAAPTQPARRPATAAPGLDVRLDRILRDSTRTAAGRRLTPEDWPDPPVRDVLSRLPIQPGLYPVEVAAVAGAFTYRSDRLAVGELGRLLAADAESAGRPILLITDLGLAAADRDPAAAARQLADAAGVPVVATAGHVYVSRDGVLVAAGSFRRFAPGAPAGSAPTVSLPGLRRARVPAADALVAEQVHAPAELPPPPPAAAESAADSPAAPTPAPTPATEVPATEVPATEVPATEVPATAVPATAVPAVEAPAVETAVAPPATEVPVVEASAVETAVEAPAEPAVPPAVEVAQPPPEQPPAAEPPAVEVAAEEPPTAEARTAGEPAEARTAGEPAEARTAGEPAGPPAAEAAQPPAAATDESGRS